MMYGICQMDMQIYPNKIYPEYSVCYYVMCISADHMVHIYAFAV